MVCQIKSVSLNVLGTAPIELPWSTLDEIVSNVTRTTSAQNPDILENFWLRRRVAFNERSEKLWQFLWLGVALFGFVVLVIFVISGFRT